jgi:hypothetical protein
MAERKSQFVKLQFRPGINRDQTNYTGEGGYWDGDRVRFFSGFPQSIGGWQRYTLDNILGTCRQLWGWITTFGDNFLALGTNEKAYIEAGGNFYDITPIASTTAAGDITFSATNLSSTITVTDNAHPVSEGDYVTFTGVDVDGLGVGGNITKAVLEQNYRVASVVDGNNYTILAKDPSTGAEVLANTSDTGNGGAAVVGAYEIPIGNPGGTYGYGFGVGPFSRGGWGSGTTTPVVLPQRDWWFGNFDNDLFMNIRNGAPYYWARGTSVDPEVPLAVRAVTLQSIAVADGFDADAVPARIMQLLMSQNDRHLIALGAVPYGSTTLSDFDPLLIRWADQDNPGQWTPSPLNSSGFLRVSRGSRIVRGLVTRQEILVWTDATLNSLQFLGTTDVFSLQEYSENISIASPRAVASANDITYWMGNDKFYTYSGRVDTLPCTVRDYVFGDMNKSQTDQIVAGTNEGFNEIWWFYPSGGSDINDRYVVFNYLENIWYFGNLSRTAWLDSPLRQQPQAVSTSFGMQRGTLFSHEIGCDADGVPMESFIQTNDVDLDEGFRFMLTKRILPDVSFFGSTSLAPEVTFAVKSRNFPGAPLENPNDDTARVMETSLGRFTQQVFIRARARQMALRVSCNTLGTKWTLGSPRVEVRTDGER